MYVLFPSSSLGPHVTIAGKDHLNFATFNFLGFIGNSKVKVGPLLEEDRVHRDMYMYDTVNAYMSANKLEIASSRDPWLVCHHCELILLTGT